MNTLPQQPNQQQSQEIVRLKGIVDTLMAKIGTFYDSYYKKDFADRFYLDKPLVLKNGMLIESDLPLYFRRADNYIGTESGANNAITANLTDAKGNTIPLTAGLEVKIKIAHSLQAGANTFAVNGTSKNIKSHNNPANNIGTAYVSGSIVHLMYDGTQWQDMSQ